MSYVTDEDKRNEDAVRRIRDGLVNLGMGHAMTEEEMEKRDERLRRESKRNAIIGNMLSCARTIVYTPLSIAFHAISFVTRGVGFVSAFGMLAGCYHIYKGIDAVMGGAAFRNVDSFVKAVPFFVIPFIAYGISEVTGRIYRYLEDNAC